MELAACNDHVAPPVAQPEDGDWGGGLGAGHGDWGSDWSRGMKLAGRALVTATGPWGSPAMRVQNGKACRSRFPFPAQAEHGISPPHPTHTCRGCCPGRHWAPRPAPGLPGSWECPDAAASSPGRCRWAQAPAPGWCSPAAEQERWVHGCCGKAALVPPSHPAPPPRVLPRTHIKTRHRLQPQPPGHVCCEQRHPASSSPAHKDIRRAAPRPTKH